MWSFRSVVNLGVLFEIKKSIHCHMFVIYLIQFLKTIKDIMRHVQEYF
jgi:hypothetical protein